MSTSSGSGPDPMTRAEIARAEAEETYGKAHDPWDAAAAWEDLYAEQAAEMPLTPGASHHDWLDWLALVEAPQTQGDTATRPARDVAQDRHTGLER